MSYDLESLTPKPSNWFSTVVEYEGWGVAEFQNPQGVVEGFAKVYFNGFGVCVVELEVKKHRTDQPLEFSLSKLNNSVCTKLVVSTRDGVFSANTNIALTDEHTEFGHSGSRKTLFFQPLQSIFSTSNSNQGAYWAMPLWNFISSCLQSRKELDQHPLRIYPTPIIPSELSGYDAINANAIANKKNKIISFEFNNALGFIETLPDYDEIKGSLTSGRERNVMTAVMVGVVGNHQIGLDSLESWFPLDFLLLLSLATGIEVGMRWLEFFDAEGKLIQRIHYNTNFANPAFSGAYRGVIEEPFHLGIGHLLTRAATSPDFDKEYLRAVLNHLIQSRRDGLFVEDRLDRLVRALDCLAEKYDVRFENFMADLEENQILMINQLPVKVEKEIKGIVSDDRNIPNSQSRILNKIASRARSAAQKDLPFGLSVVTLLKKFGLPDAEILDNHYKDHPRADGRDWAALLSMLRGVSIHSGYFEFTNDKHNPQEIVIVVKHLYDILIRLMLKILCYEGTYQPAVLMHPAKEYVDWVKPDTPASRLGYK